jgi:hypothetical protein
MSPITVDEALGNDAKPQKRRTPNREISEDRSTALGSKDSQADPESERTQRPRA